MVQLLVQWKESTLALLNNLSSRHLCKDSLPQTSMAQTKDPEEPQSYDHLSLITQYRTINTNRANSSM